MNQVEDAYDFLDQTTPADAIRDATAFPTVPTGRYRLEIQTKEIQTAGERSPWPGRMIVHCKVQLLDRETGDKKKTEFFDMSPVEYRNASGRLDGPYQLWCHAIKALGLTGASNRDVVAALDSIPYDAWVREAFRVVDANGQTSWRTPRNEEERSEYLNDGAEARNFVQSLKTLKV